MEHRFLTPHKNGGREGSIPQRYVTKNKCFRNSPSGVGVRPIAMEWDFCSRASESKMTWNFAFSQTLDPFDQIKSKCSIWNRVWVYAAIIQVWRVWVWK